MELYLLGTVILVPMILAVCCILFKNETARKIMIWLNAAFLTSAALWITKMLWESSGEIVFSADRFPAFLPLIIEICEGLLLLFILYIGMKLKKKKILIFTVIQVFTYIYMLFFADIHMEAGDCLFRIDYLSLVMLLIVSVIGPLVVIFGLGYMPVHEAHRKMRRSRQPAFFAVLLFFLGSMNALVLSNNVLWLYFFWEVTTVCSFLLISHDKTPAALNNASKALWINLFGGVAFSIAIIIFVKIFHTLQIHRIIGEMAFISKSGAPVIVPIALACICFACFTKAAQIPFQSWILGAMTAPTPVSSLLHSSTMVKAGVYLIIRFSPAMQGTPLSFAVSFIGGFSFMAASAIAISQTDGKRVLAYSTVANLGLVICCAGVGNWLAISAAILLTIFHAVSKGLLFLCVGTIEHGIGSRNIEDMQGMFKRMPFTTAIAVIGMISMLLPPFGVLLTKWMAMEAAVNSPFILVMIALGSAFTVAFWAKWVGIILTFSYKPHYKTEKLSFHTYFSLSFLLGAVIAFGMCIVPIFNQFIAPYLREYGLEEKAPVSATLIILLFAVVFLLIILMVIFGKNFNDDNIREPYLCGENTGDIRGIEFVGPQDKKQAVVVHNYYLENTFGEEILTKIINSVAIAGIIIMFGVVIQKWIIH